MENTWLRRIRGAVGTGLTWGAAWALVGLLIALLVDPQGAIDDMWVATLGVPGFLSGVAFSAVLGVAEGHRRLEELSVPRVAGWGALAGLLLGLVPLALATPVAPLPPALTALLTLGPITLLSGASASLTLVVARRAEERSLGSGPDPDP